MHRITWLKHLLEAIAQFASEEFQRSAWVEFNGPDGSSFEEASELLEDLRLEEAISLPSDLYRLEPAERKVLSEFWRALDDYSKQVYKTRVRKVGENYASPTLVISQPGSSPYTSLQQLKDWWLKNAQGYTVNVARDR